MVISQKAKIFSTGCILYRVGNKIDYSYVVGTQRIVPSPYYCLIPPVGTMHRAPTLLFCVFFGLQSLYYNHINFNLSFKLWLTILVNLLKKSR